MVAVAPVCLAEFLGVKAIAVLALGVVLYLYWSGVKEKRVQRRDREWLETRRREIKAKAATRSPPPPEV